MWKIQLVFLMLLSQLKMNPAQSWVKGIYQVGITVVEMGSRAALSQNEILQG